MKTRATITLPHHLSARREPKASVAELWLRVTTSALPLLKKQLSLSARECERETGVLAAEGCRAVRKGKNVELLN